MNGGDHSCPGRLALERYLLGELSGPERSRIERAVADCPKCAEAVATLRADDAAFALRPVPQALRELWTAPPRRSVPWLRVAVLAAPLAAAAVVLLVVAMPVGGIRDVASVGGTPGIGDRMDPGTMRAKGAGSTDPSDLALGFYVLGPGGEPTLGRPGQVLREGDSIQFWFDGGGGSEAVLVGIDGRRQVTRYFPERGGAAPLPPGGRLLDSAVLLDDARGAERFFLCAGVGVDVERVEAAAREIAASGIDLARVERLRLDCRQATVWILKEQAAP